MFPSLEEKVERARAEAARERQEDRTALEQRFRVLDAHLTAIRVLLEKILATKG